LFIRLYGNRERPSTAVCHYHVFDDQMQKQVLETDMEFHLRKNDLHTFAYLYLNNKGTMRDMKDLNNMGKGIYGGERKK
jgi:hypothetical protein